MASLLCLPVGALRMEGNGTLVGQRVLGELVHHFAPVQIAPALQSQSALAPSRELVCQVALRRACKVFCVSARALLARNGLTAAPQMWLESNAASARTF